MISGIRHILLDIEGTTCPVSFVSDVLFPYAKTRLAGYLAQHGQDAEIQALLQELQNAWEHDDDAEAQALLKSTRTAPHSPSNPADLADGSAGVTAVSTESLLVYLHWLIQQDRKVTAWKELQGRIWQDGYGRGELMADLFDDVVPVLRRWKQQGLELSVYSSGSVAAQQLLYGHCREGDVRDLFSHWFDTRIGAKQSEDSYRRILEGLGCRAEQVLFISDAIAELQAASAAGLQVSFSDREGNPQRDPGPYPHISRLDQLILEP